MGKFARSAALAGALGLGAIGWKANLGEDTSPPLVPHAENSELDSELNRQLTGRLVELDTLKLSNPGTQLSDFIVQFGNGHSIIAVHGFEDIRFLVGDSTHPYSKVEFKDSGTPPVSNKLVSGVPFDYFVDTATGAFFNSAVNSTLSDNFDLSKVTYAVNREVDSLPFDSDKVTSIFSIDCEGWLSSVDALNGEKVVLKSWQIAEGDSVEYGAAFESSKNGSRIELNGEDAEALFGRLMDGLKPKYDRYLAQHEKLIERAFEIISSSDLPNTEKSDWKLESDASYSDNSTPLQHGRRYRCNLGEGLGIEIHQVIVSSSVNGQPLYDSVVRMRQVSPSGDFGEVITRSDGQHSEKAICHGGNARAMLEAVERL